MVIALGYITDFCAPTESAWLVIESCGTFILIMVSTMRVFLTLQGFWAQRIHIDLEMSLLRCAGLLG